MMVLLPEIVNASCSFLKISQVFGKYGCTTMSWCSPVHLSRPSSWRSLVIPWSYINPPHCVKKSVLGIIQSECGKIRTRITLNTYTFHAMPGSKLGLTLHQLQFSQNAFKSLRSAFKILPNIYEEVYLRK